jgi:hypothetical protein
VKRSIAVLLLSGLFTACGLSGSASMRSEQRYTNKDQHYSVDQPDGRVQENVHEHVRAAVDELSHGHGQPLESQLPELARPERHVAEPRRDRAPADGARRQVPCLGRFRQPHHLLAR